MPRQPVRHAVSIIIPVLNEAPRLARQLSGLARLRADGHEVVVIDGGSEDDSAVLAAAHADQVRVTGRGRARQMNAGARLARYDCLLFLHADTELPDTAVDDIAAAFSAGHVWGRFDVRIAPSDWLLNMVAAGMNLRSRLTGVATGDQAIFVKREAFFSAGGYPDIALMEDLALCDRLRPLGRPACLCSRVTTSARRWVEHGRLRTIMTMWRLRLGYRLGVNPDRLAAIYYR